MMLLTDWPCPNSRSFGKALILDNIIQCTEFDEFSYQEMISFLPLCSHPNPERVLVVGGGDGGVAREAVKHPRVLSVDVVEIDERVVRLSEQYLPFMACGFQHEKVTLHIEDGFEFMKNNAQKFDIIITDSSDPVGKCFGQLTYSNGSHNCAVFICRSERVVVSKNLH